ncbi:hypothetical protein [Geobacter sp.]|uniref:hypothetical protein n=1 Tax=Geobacter sp. TaxID=46610 RepID=UPI00261043BF|nr:hypothetical protein [Geobacter sp.]
MRGIPRHLNTKQDYLTIRNEFPPEVWRPRFQALLDERFAWLPVGPLAEGEPGVTDDTHRVVELLDEASQTMIERIQEEYREDPNATIFRLGFTVEEVSQLVGE